MSIINGDQCILKLERLFFEELKFIRNTEEFTNFDYKPVFKKSIQSLDNNLYKVSLSLNIHNKGEEFLAFVKIVGIFRIEGNIDTGKILINNNTIAILFPYIRSQITVLTAQPYMQPIILPPININALLETSND